MKKSELFKTAWATARTAAITFGGTVKSYFSESLKMAWNNYKNGIKVMELKENEGLVINEGVNTELKIRIIKIRAWNGDDVVYGDKYQDYVLGEKVSVVWEEKRRLLGRVVRPGWKVAKIA